MVGHRQRLHDGRSDRAQRAQRPEDLRPHRGPAPGAGRRDARGVHERETAPRAREAGDHLGPASRLREGALQEVRRAEPLLVLPPAQQRREARVEVLLETRHRGRVPAAEAGKERPAAAEARRGIGREEDLRQQGRELGGRALRQRGQDGPQRVPLAALPPDPGDDRRHRADQAGIPIGDHEERRGEMARGQVVADRAPGVRALPRPQAQVQPDDLAILAERVGAEDPFLLGARRARRLERAIAEQGEDRPVPEVPRAPGVALGLKGRRGAAGGALRAAAAEDLRAVAGREPADVVPADQGAELRRHPLPLVGQRDRYGHCGVSHRGRPQMQHPGFGLQRGMAVAVAVAGDRAVGPLGMAAAQDTRHRVLEARLQAQRRGPADARPERVAGEASREVVTTRCLHLGARGSSLHGVGAPCSVRGERSGWATGRIPSVFSHLHLI